MVCVAHKWQTLSKDPFYEYTEHVLPYENKEVIKKHYDLLETILSGEKD